MSDLRATISKLERDYANHREAFKKWKDEHATLAGHASYNEYVDRFNVWERDALNQLRELRASAVRKPVAPEPELPTIDLSTQLNEFLEEITAPEFIMGFMTMVQKDATVLHKAFEVVLQETKGTCFSSPIFPQIPQASIKSQQPKTGYPSTSQLTPRSYGSTSALQSQNLVEGYQLKPSSSFSNLPQYGIIPEGWAVEAPIIKPSKTQSPAREYSKVNLPFKDFSQT